LVLSTCICLIRHNSKR